MIPPASVIYGKYQGALRKNLTSMSIAYEHSFIDNVNWPSWHAREENETFGFEANRQIVLFAQASYGAGLMAQNTTDLAARNLLNVFT